MPPRRCFDYSCKLILWSEADLIVRNTLLLVKFMTTISPNFSPTIPPRKTPLKRKSPLAIASSTWMALDLPSIRQLLLHSAVIVSILQSPIQRSTRTPNLHSTISISALSAPTLRLWLFLLISALPRPHQSFRSIIIPLPLVAMPLCTMASSPPSLRSAAPSPVTFPTRPTLISTAPPTPSTLPLFS